MTRSFRLSPSDFAYLYEECKRCYWLKTKGILDRPKGIFPAVFGAINTRVQGELVGKDLRELSPNLPEGFVESQEKFVESIPFPGTNVYISGKYDILVKLTDGTYMVIDFKLSKPGEEKVQKYQSQLWAYKFAFENSANDDKKIISRMGLVMIYPDQVKFERGVAMLDFPPIWLEVTPNDEAFKKFMLEINDLLNEPEPEANEKCAWCKYRRDGKTLEHDKNIDDVVDF